MTAEQIASMLVARRWAERIPLSKTRCEITIQLKAINDGTGFLYVKRDGEIRVGHTLRESRPVGPQTRHAMLGEPS